MFHQKPDGTFEDVTEKSGLKGVGLGMGVAIADYDNDGFEDVFVTAYGGNRLYRGTGNCTFRDVTEEAGLAQPQAAGNTWYTSAAWVDLDNDGLLDLVVERYIQWDWEDIWCGEHREGYRGYCHPDHFPPIPMLVYHNDGKGHFTEVSHKLGLDKPAKALGIAIADYDRDGRIDLFVANDSSPEFLFHQKPDGTFEEVGIPSGAAVDAGGDPFAGMGVDFADYDNDGWPDLAVTDLSGQRYAIYRNRHDGTFDDVSDSTGIGAMTQPYSGWGMRFLDYDNDGWKDLLIAQGHDTDNIEKIHSNIHYRQPMLLARNTGNGFVDVSSISGEVFKEGWVGRGMATGDLDNDGRVDAVVSTNGGLAHILRNETATGNHWLSLHLTGHKSNRDGIGAVVKLTTACGSQWATVTTSSSYLSASDPRVHFGLGKVDADAAIEIRWPSGIVQTLNHEESTRKCTWRSRAPRTRLQPHHETSSLFLGSNVQSFYDVCIIRVKLERFLQLLFALVEISVVAQSQPEVFVQSRSQLAIFARHKGFFQYPDRLRPILLIGSQIRFVAQRFYLG